MRVLLDHCVPRAFARLLAGHEVGTAAERGWGRLKNGSLLFAAASAGYDAMITVDQNLRHEQNPADLPLRVVVMIAPSNDIDDLARLAPGVLNALAQMPPRTLVEVAAGPRRAS